MAIYHCSVKTIGRSAGRSATAAAAYRAGIEITDERTGEVHDYTRRSGVLHTEIMAPDHAPEWTNDRAQLWNAVEKVERRKDAQLCREVLVALPAELDDAERLDGYLSRTHYGYHDKATTKAERTLARKYPAWAQRVPAAREQVAVERAQQRALQQAAQGMAKQIVSLGSFAGGGGILR